MSNILSLSVDSSDSSLFLPSQNISKRRISMDERHFLSEYRETFDVIFILY